jgi:hypothetical protein
MPRQEADFYEGFFFIINFQKENAFYLTLLIILIVVKTEKSSNRAT